MSRCRWDPAWGRCGGTCAPTAASATRSSPATRSGASFGFARPHRRPIGVFLVLTVVDAALVVVTPLLVKRIVDDGILKQDAALVVWLALAMAAVAVVDAGARRSAWAGSPRASARA